MQAVVLFLLLVMRVEQTPMPICYSQDLKMQEVGVIYNHKVESLCDSFGFLECLHFCVSVWPSYPLLQTVKFNSLF